MIAANAHTQLVKACLEYLALHKIPAWKSGTFSGRLESGRYMQTGTPGQPDISAILDGYYLAIEVKTGTGRLTPHQKAFADMVTKAGGHYWCVRSLDGQSGTCRPCRNPGNR